MLGYIFLCYGDTKGVDARSERHITAVMNLMQVESNDTDSSCGNYLWYHNDTLRIFFSHDFDAQ